MSRYPKCDYEAGSDSTVLQCGRGDRPKTVAVAPDLPGNVILVHGVNDVGVSYAQVEAGLCAGLRERLEQRTLEAANYRMPAADDAKRLEPDPDAVFFKRTATQRTHNPVIPFYWGYRPAKGDYKSFRNTAHGQAVDRWGNRLDRDFSKGGGPFANATSTLPDMWNRGFGSAPGDPVDRITADPLRPVLDAPGRMYMVLAAQRLAALVAMIRDFEPDDTVSLVAHSQGCMLSLLAQAFLMQKGLRPADTLVLTHPPYSLVDDIPLLNDTSNLFCGGQDPRMREHYGALSGTQTLHARLQTLVQIVQGVVSARHASPALAALQGAQGRGMVGTRWEATGDRDNRGKVYLYFCPEDMTVALDNVQGIGWQGVPDYVDGSRQQATLSGQLDGVLPVSENIVSQPGREVRQALRELGSSFLQRVFTARLRAPADAPPGALPQPVLVGAPPGDFALRIKGEDDHAHAAAGSVSLRARCPEVEWPPERWATHRSEAQRRLGLRRITGEALKTPVQADMYAGALDLPGQPRGAHEKVDPIDAAISVTSRYGLQDIQMEPMQDPRPPLQQRHIPGNPMNTLDLLQVEQVLNDGREPEDRCHVRSGRYDGQPGLVHIVRTETPNEARLRQQQSTSSRSFHGAIFGSEANHRQVTAWDVAIGSGKAVSHPLFRAYLCAVADWRLKEPKPNESVRPGILEWQDFNEQFHKYFDAEPDWRKQLIRGNCVYYSTGELPSCLPLVTDLPPAVVNETMSGLRVGPTPAARPPRSGTGRAGQGGRQ